MSLPPLDPVVPPSREEAILREVCNELARLDLVDRLRLQRQGMLIKHLLARASLSWPEYRHLLRDIQPGGPNLLEAMLEYAELNRPGPTLFAPTQEDEEEDDEDRKVSFAQDDEEAEEEEEEEDDGPQCEAVIKSGARKGEPCGRKMPCSIHKAKVEPKPKGKATKSDVGQLSTQATRAISALRKKREEAMSEIGRPKSATGKESKGKAVARK